MQTTHFKTGDAVELVDIVNGGVCIVTGTVQKVAPFFDYQYVCVKGFTASGIPVQSHTFSDDKSLKKVVAHHESV